MTPSTLPDTSKGVTLAATVLQELAHDPRILIMGSDPRAAIADALAALSPLPAPEPTEGIAELVGRLAEVERQRDEWKATHGRVVEGFMEVCEAVGVQFDAPEAVAYAINTKIGNAEHDKRAAEAERDDLDRRLNEEQMQTANGGAVAWRGVVDGRTAFLCRTNDEVARLAADYDAVIEPLFAHPAPADKGVVEARAELWPKPGDKMRFRNENGYPFELADAQKVMTEGQIFTVKKCRVGDFSHSVEFEEITGNWNGVMFELLAASPPTEGDGR